MGRENEKQVTELGKEVKSLVMLGVTVNSGVTVFTSPSGHPGREQRLPGK